MLFSALLKFYGVLLCPSLLGFLSVVRVFTILARSHVGIRTRVAVESPLSPSNTSRTNLVALLSASALSHIEYLVPANYNELFKVLAYRALLHQR